MPSLFVVSPERRAPLADNRHNIFRRVFLQGGLGTSPGSGRGERELTRSGTIILKPSLQNHLDFSFTYLMSLSSPVDM